MLCFLTQCFIYNYNSSFFHKILTQSLAISVCQFVWYSVNCVKCAGEQDESAFDISQLKMPIDSLGGRYRVPAVEKVMPPPIPSMDRPKKWGKSIMFLCSVY